MDYLVFVKTKRLFKETLNSTPTYAKTRKRPVWKIQAGPFQIKDIYIAGGKKATFLKAPAVSISCTHVPEYQVEQHHQG